jgi:hypothetical protein
MLVALVNKLITCFSFMDSEKVSNVVRSYSADDPSGSSSPSKEPVTAPHSKSLSVDFEGPETACDKHFVSSTQLDGAKHPFAARDAQVHVEPLSKLQSKHTPSHDCPDLTPLMIAAQEGDCEAVRCCIENGADVHAKDKAGHNCLMHALDNSAIIALLLQQGTFHKIC